MTSIAGLDGGQQGQIAELLGRCVVRITAGGITAVGFFIAPRQILTSRHVVAMALGQTPAPISVQWFPGGGGGPRTLAATIGWLPEAPDWPDIAILDVPEATDPQCVMLDLGKVLVDTPLMTAGYPAGALMAFQSFSFTAGFPALGEGEARELRIEGDVVADGMSGSPIVSLQSGLVIGILRISRGSHAPLGGFGTMSPFQPDLG